MAVPGSDHSEYELAVYEQFMGAVPFRKRAYHRWLNMHRARMLKLLTDARLTGQPEVQALVRSLLREHM